MKNQGRNFFKYIFILVVIGLIVGAFYLLYYKNKGDDDDDDDVVDEEATQQTDSEISIVDNLKMAITGYDTLNPILTKNREIINIDKLIFEPLVSITSDYNTENCLAKSVEKTSDTKYTIKLNNSVKWQDGNDLIAKDVEFTVNKIKENNSLYLQNVENIASIEIPDAETVIFSLNQPDKYFEYKLDFPIIPYLYYVNEDFPNSSKIPIGTGMYKIASNDNNNIFLIINERWRNYSSKKPKTQSITIQKNSAIGEAFNAFKLGSIDIINTNKTDYSNYVGTMGYNKKEYSGRNFDYISFNCKDQILSDKAVRKAISQAINKENIVSTVYKDSKIVSNTPLDYGSYLNTNDGIPSYNHDEAKKTLEDDGWVFTNNRWQKNIDGYVRKLSISLIVRNDSQDRINACENIKNQLKEIGIQVNVSKVDINKYNELLNSKNYQMMLTGVTNAVSPDIDFFYGSNNLANYHNDEISSKINDIKNYKDIIKIANDDVPYIGLYRNKTILLLNANVGGNFTPNNYFTYYNFNEWFRQQ